MFQRSLVAALLAAILLLAGCSDEPASETADALVASKTFTMTDTQGQTYTITKEAKRFVVQGHEDKIVLFDIFATWCQPCRAEASHLASLQQKYPDDIIVLGVTIEEGISNAALNTFKKENGAAFTIFNSETNRPLYRNIAASINIGGQFPIPLMVMYNKGNYVTHYLGMVAEEMIESDILVALGRK